jgi:hypothetical protein
MVTASLAAIMKRHTQYAVIALAAVNFSQYIAYGLHIDYSFFFRNISIAGGLLMLLADSMTTSAKAKSNIFAGLPSMNERNHVINGIHIGGSKLKPEHRHFLFS